MTTQAILVATDLGPSSDEALRQAHERATRRQLPLIVCHVLGSGPRTRRGAIEVQVFRATGRFPPAYELVLADGEPGKVITALAIDRGVGLIVLGGRRASGLRRALLGGVAERVVRRATTSVLIARQDSEGPNVVAGTDFSDPALPALTAGAEEAAERGGTLAACHAIPYSVVMTAAAPDRAVTPSLLAPLERSADRRLADAMSTLGARATTRVELAEPSGLLLRVAEDLQAGLVVVGTRGRTGLRRVLFGSTAERVLRHARSSVLVVRLANERRV